MKKYLEVAQILKEKLYRYKKNEVIRMRGMFLRNVILEKINGTPLYIACEKRGQNKQYFHFWLKRLKEHNYDIECLSGYSKKPLKSPNEIDEEIIDRAIEIRGDEDIGGHTISYMLKEEGLFVAGSTVCAHFKKKGISNVYKYKKVNGHTKRYSAENPLDRVQTDSSWSGYEDIHGNRIYFFPVVDDCTRSVTVHVADSKCSNEAVESIHKFINKFGTPKVVQTDNGVEYTNKYISENNPLRKKPARLGAFEAELSSLQIDHQLIRLRTPQLNGKVERFNRTIKKAMETRLYDGVTKDEAQQIVDHWLEFYNKKRPHHSLKMLTPYKIFNQFFLPKSA